MTRKPKHRFDEAEAEAAYALLTQEEKEEYQSIALTDGLATASNQRLNKLESIGYERLRNQSNG